MKKLLELKRLNPSLALRVLYIYGLKALRRPVTGENLVILGYFNLLIRGGFNHVSYDGNFFKVKTDAGACLFMRKHPSSDGQVLYQIWKDEEYAVVVDHIRKNNHSTALRIIDAGANVGYASVYLYHKLKDKFDIELVLIEPGDDNVLMIEKNFKENNINKYHIEKAGLFNKTAYLALNRDFRDGKDWSLTVQEVNYPTDLKGVELLDLLKKHQWSKADFCKIDIEGSERFLFEDAGYASRFLEKINLLSVEIHEEFIPATKIESVLSANSFSHFKHGEITIGYK